MPDFTQNHSNVGSYSGFSVASGIGSIGGYNFSFTNAPIYLYDNWGGFFEAFHLDADSPTGFVNGLPIQNISLVFTLPLSALSSSSDLLPISADFLNANLLYDQVKISVGSRGFPISGSQEGTIAGVPEPSTWAMIILGFAGIGFMAYRRLAQGSGTRCGLIEI